MSDPDLDLIQQAHDALNTTDARINGFLDSVDDEVDARLTVAETELGQRQAAYDALAADLVEVVSDHMKVKIDYDPDAPDADLTPDGHFRNWGELATFAANMPNNSEITVRLPDNSVLVTDGGVNSTSHGIRHWKFTALTPLSPLGDHTPVVEFGLYDQVTYNEYHSLDLGNQGTLEANYVRFRWATPANPALPFSSNTMFLSLGSNNSVDLRNCEVENDDGLFFARVTTGSIAKIALHSVVLDGDVTFLFRSGSSNIALMTTGAVTTLNGAEIYSPTFTVGTNLITN